MPRLKILTGAAFAAGLLIVLTACPSLIPDERLEPDEDEPDKEKDVVACKEDALVTAIQDAESGDTLTLNSGCTYSHDTSLSPNALPTINATLTIDGNGATIERSSGAPAFRLLHVGTSGDLTLTDVTLRNGLAEGTFPDNAGGALFNEGTATLRNVALSDNEAKTGGAIWSPSGSTLTLENSTVSNNNATDRGGGILTEADTTTITNSTISGNSADRVGGISTGGELTIENSTISGNSTQFEASAIEDLNSTSAVTIAGSTISGNSGGSAIKARDGTTLINSTISGNSGGAGIRATSATPKIVFSTVVDNEDEGLSINSEQDAAVKNSLIAANGGKDCGGDIFKTDASGANFDTDGTCAAQDSAFTQVSENELLLGKLELNAPGDTKTHALLKDAFLGGGDESVAIDAAPDCTDLDGDAVGADQRGVSRPQAGDCDVGAFELQQ